jgi:hypothetical protein
MDVDPGPAMATFVFRSSCHAYYARWLVLFHRQLQQATTTTLLVLVS